MPIINVVFGTEPVWPELAAKYDAGEVYWLGEGAPMIQIAGLEGGMKSGKPSLVIRLELPDGKVVMAETSWALFDAAHAALRGRFGAPV